MDMRQYEMDSTADFITDALMKHLKEPRPVDATFSTLPLFQNDIMDQRTAGRFDVFKSSPKKQEVSPPTPPAKELQEVKDRADKSLQIAKSIRTSSKYLLEIQKGNQGIDKIILDIIAKGKANSASAEEVEKWRTTTKGLLQQFIKAENGVHLSGLDPLIKEAHLKEMNFLNSLKKPRDPNQKPNRELTSKGNSSRTDGKALVLLDSKLKSENIKIQEALDEARRQLERYSKGT